MQSITLRASDVYRTLDLLHVDSLVLPEFAVNRLSSVNLVQIFQPEIGVSASDGFCDQIEVAHRETAASTELLAIDIVHALPGCISLKRRGL